MESKLLIDIDYNGRPQITIKHKVNDEDPRDKLVHKLIWNQSDNKRTFCVIQVYNDNTDGSCIAEIRPLDTAELKMALPEMLERIQRWEKVIEADKKAGYCPPGEEPAISLEALARNILGIPSPVDRPQG